MKVRRDKSAALPGPIEPGRSDTLLRDSVDRIVATLTGLAATAIAMRALIWWPSAVQMSGLPTLSWRILFFSRDDFRVLLFFALILFALAAMLIRSTRSLTWLSRLALTLSVVAALILGINVTAVQWLRSPITYQWLYYADLLQSFTGQAAVSSVISFRALVSIIVALVTLLVVRVIVLRRLRVSHGRTGRVWMAPLVTLALLAIFARFDSPGLEGAQSGRIVNPIREFAGTSLASLRSPLSTMKTDIGSEDFRIGSATGPSRLPHLDRRKRDILMIVMESVSADDLIAGPNGKPAIAMPNIAALRAAGQTFTNIYVPVPSSTRTNFVINTGRYPLFTYRPETRTLPDYRFVTLGQRLKKAGYRTAFFMGGDFSYQGVGHFLVDKGFDRLADIETINCRATRPNITAPDMAMSKPAADRCLADAVIEWNRARDDRPTFTIAWTIDTHFPYLAAAPGQMGSRQAFLDSMRSSDAAIGKILDSLRAEGRLDDMIVMIIGDHGESFGRHGFTFHGSSILDEEIRIPFIISAPALFHGTTDNELGSLVDLPPTILDLIGLDREPSWSGHSLFDLHRPPRVYFFASKGNLVAGYREGNAKFVIDVWKDQVDRFDLIRDPGERQPIRIRGAQADAVKRRIAAWVQYQERLYATR